MSRTPFPLPPDTDDDSNGMYLDDGPVWSVHNTTREIWIVTPEGSK